MKDRNPVLGRLLGGLALVASLLTAPVSPAAAAADQLPDLRMARLTDFHVERTPDGRKLLRFSSVVVNVGAGPFQATGTHKNDRNELTTIQQRIFDTAGGFSDVPVFGTHMYWSGDGHQHWHIKDLETFRLHRLDNGAPVETGAKHGFCFYDNVDHRALPGHPHAPVYTRCGSSPGDTSVTMGLSVGWGDLYRYTLPDQYIDITALRSGRYRLHATADEQDWFWEQDDSNNQTWTDIRIRGNSVRVVGYGPAA